MKYRIKKVIYKDGEVKYFAQYCNNWFVGWRGIFSNGEISEYSSEVGEQYSREGALRLIDLADAGKGIIVKIEFENVNK